MGDGDFEVVSMEAEHRRDRFATGQRILAYIEHALLLQNADFAARQTEIGPVETAIRDTFVDQLKNTQRMLIENMRQLTLNLPVTDSAVPLDSVSVFSSSGEENHNLVRSSTLVREGSLRHIEVLHKLLKSQLGILLVRPVSLRTRGSYRPLISSCSLSCRYGEETYVFKEDDFVTTSTRMVQLNLDLLPRDLCLRVQQSIFRTSMHPFRSLKFVPKSINRNVCNYGSMNSQNPPVKSLLEVSFFVENGDSTGEVTALFEVEWLFARRPFFLGPLKDSQLPENTVTLECDMFNMSVHSSH